MSAITLEEILRDTDLVAVLIPAKAGVVSVPVPANRKPRPTFVRPLREEVKPTPLREAVIAPPIQYPVEVEEVDPLESTLRDLGLEATTYALDGEDDWDEPLRYGGFGQDLSDRAIRKLPVDLVETLVEAPTEPHGDLDTDADRRNRLAEILGIDGDLTDENLEG